MRVLFATEHAYPPLHVGGSESSTHDLCLTLRERGIEVVVLSALFQRGVIQPGRRLAFRLRPKETWLLDETPGYPVLRCRTPMSAIPRAVREFHPNAAVLQVASFALAERFIGGGVPCIVYLRDGDFARLGGPIREAPNLRYLATSRDLVRRFEQSFGIVPLCLPPVVRAERYRVAPRRTNVTFVCPFPTKGVDVALHLAAQRPDIPFAFVESWHLPLPRRFALHRRLRTTPNVTYRPRSDDMRAVYREAKALLVPSRTAEGWGRVVSEAQVSGLPVIATDYGALPEAVGPGGILVDPAADLGEWEDALARIWDDDAEYERLAALAEAHARRPEFRPAALIEKLLAVLSDLIET